MIKKKSFIFNFLQTKFLKKKDYQYKYKNLQINRPNSTRK